MGLGSSSEIIVSLGDFNGHVGKCAEGFEGVHGRNDIRKRNALLRTIIVALLRTIKFIFVAYDQQYCMEVKHVFK